MRAPSDNRRAPAPVREVSPRHVLRWLRLGWRDMVDCGWPSLVHGLIVALGGLGILQLAQYYWPLLPGAMSGFILVGPILATGMYALSRARRAGDAGGFSLVLRAWRRGTRCLVAYGLLLLLLGTAWVLVSAAMFHLFVDVEIAGPVSFLRYVLVQDDLAFGLWTVLGALGSALLFAISVVSVPMLFDRDVGMIKALLTSVRATGDNPITLGCWAVVIAVGTGLSVATFMIGFVVVYPVLGHASWYVYLDIVERDGIPPSPALD